MQCATINVKGSTSSGSSYDHLHLLLSEIPRGETTMQYYSGTLLRNWNGSSSFCKGPRTSKVWKSKDPKGPRTLRLCMSEDLCKNYYSHLNFTVVTFLTKIQNWCYKTNKKLVKTQLSKKFGWEKPLLSKKFGWEKPFLRKIQNRTSRKTGKKIVLQIFWTVVVFPIQIFLTIVF